MFAKINNCKLVCFAFFILLLTIAGASCRKPSGATNKKETQSDSYRCPMNCTGEIFHKPGTCPVCKLELEKIANG